MFARALFGHEGDSSFNSSHGMPGGGEQATMLIPASIAM